MFATQQIYESMQKNVDFSDSPFESPHSAGEMKPKIQNVRMTNAEWQGAVALVAYCLAGLIRKLIMIVTAGKQEDDTSLSTIL
jgi:flagellar biosynthesis/type III secretory pathway M-ring protein FliF/YscJ